MRQATSPERPVLWRQLAIGVLLFGIYLAVDSLESPARRLAATSHGRDIFTLEQHLHIDVERSLNSWLAPHRFLATLANYEYAWTYIISAVALMTWVLVRRPELWRATRDSFVVLNLLAFACFALYPTAPPRMLTDLGFVDTVSRGGTVGSWGSGLVDAANQLAAMPSLHVGWALWVSVVLAEVTAGRRVQLISGLHVLLTLFVVMATANHYLLDAVVVVVPVLLGVRYAKWRYPEVARGTVVPACDAFFLHAEDTGAAQHVGGLAILEPAGPAPTIEQVRELVRAELAGLPRFRQRLSQPTRWRRPRWVEEPDVDLEWHVVERRSQSGLAGLHRIVADFAEQPMPRDRPLWRVLMVRDVAPGTSPASSAMVFLAHHAIADGIGTVLHALSLFRPRTDLRPPDRRSPGPLRRAAAVTVGLAQLATDGGASSPGEGSRRRAFQVVDIDLESARRAASTYGARVTDLVLALVADAVHATSPDLVVAVQGRLRCSVPIMVRTPDSSAEGNATATVMVDAPLDGRPFDELVAEIGARTARLRRPTRALASRFVMATGLRVLPEPCVGWFARTVYGARFFHAVVSNMPGPTPQLRLLGVPLRRVYPILPVAPGTPLALGALSWTGVLGVGLAADPALLDVGALAAHITARMDGQDVGSHLRPREGEEQARA